MFLFSFSLTSNSVKIGGSLFFFFNQASTQIPIPLKNTLHHRTGGLIYIQFIYNFDLHINFETTCHHLTCCALAQNISSKKVANPSLIHSSVQSRAPMASPNQAWAISWHRRVPQRWLPPGSTLCDRKMMWGLHKRNEWQNPLVTCHNVYCMDIITEWPGVDGNLKIP